MHLKHNLCGTRPYIAQANLISLFKSRNRLRIPFDRLEQAAESAESG